MVRVPTHRRVILWAALFVAIIFCVVPTTFPSGTVCVLPDVSLNRPQLLSSNDSPSVNFSWTPLGRENRTICHHAFSVRVYQSSIPYDFEDNMEPPHDPSGRYEEVNQQTNYIFNDINRDTYYLFELRVQSPPRSNRYYSYVHYFGDQVPVRVTNPVRGHTVIRVTEGDSVTVPCEGTGIPTPTMRLLRDVTSVPQTCGGCPPINKNNVFESVRQQDAGEYYCVAVNTLVNPPEGKRLVTDWKTIVLIVEPVPILPPSNVSRCLPYTHNTCRPFLVQTDLIFVNASVNNDVKLLELQDQVISLFRRLEHRANRSELSSLDPALKNRCQRLAQSIACHSVYPYCDPSHDVSTPRLICKTSCDAFSAGGICERFISEAGTPELYSRLAAKCDTREHPAGSSPECIPIDVETAQIGHYNVMESSLCVTGNGRSYVGRERRTRSGLDCQSWGSQAPHKHPFLPSTYSPELFDRFSCRNPGGVGAGPWCYTSDPNIRWEYCDIPKCEICQEYNNYGFCRSINGYNGNGTVYVDRGPNWGLLGLSSIESFMENLLSQLTDDVGNSTWTPGCEHATRQLLCHVTLPLCKNQETAAPMLACSGCQLLDTIQFCSTIVYSRLITEMQGEPSRFHFQRDDCLATANDDREFPSSGPDCMPPPQGLPTGTDDCYSSLDHGQSYTGQLASTQRGDHCQSWNEPHLLFHPGFYPELDGAANLCRNPGQLKDRIWCFTSESAWDYCPIPTNCTSTTPVTSPITSPATPVTTAFLPALTPPSEIEAHCFHVNWRNSPDVSCGDITGYDVRLFNPDTGVEVTRRVDARGTFHNFLLLERELVEYKSTTVQIRIVSSLGEGAYSSPIGTGCFAPQPPSVYFELKGERYVNNSVVNILAIGEGSSALLCKTNKQDCCGTLPNRFGEFYYPHGARVSIFITGDGFYRNRGNQMIRLNRRNDVSSPTGRYSCEIPDASGITQKLFINISNEGM